MSNNPNHTVDDKENIEDVVSEEATASVNDSQEATIMNSASDNPEVLDKAAQLEQKIAELKDLYVRAQAEMQNIQRRSSEEVKKARDYAISSFARDMVIVKDYLEMALKDESGNFETIKTGVDLTLKQLVQIFERHMIKEVNPEANEKLDPHLHQAVSTVETEGVEPNTIVNVMQKGYILNQRVLRPAMVTVTK